MTMTTNKKMTKMTLTQEFEQLNYSQALESDSQAQEWLQKNQRRFGHYINGEFVSQTDAPVIDVYNPATSDLLAQIEVASSEQVDKAISCARKAQPSWWAIGGFGRAKILYALARNLQKYARLAAVLETLDNGKPIRESRDADIPLAIRHLYHHAGWAKLQDETFPNHGPVGVAAQIIPWNFPLLMLSWKVAPAIAMGNTIVIKPAEQTPLTDHVNLQYHSHMFHLLLLQFLHFVLIQFLCSHLWNAFHECNQLQAVLYP